MYIKASCRKLVSSIFPKKYSKLLYTSFEAVTEISSISINFAIMTTSAAHCAYYEINK